MQNIQFHYENIEYLQFLYYHYFVKEKVEYLPQILFYHFQKREGQKHFLNFLTTYLPLLNFLYILYNIFLYFSNKKFPIPTPFNFISIRNFKSTITIWTFNPSFRSVYGPINITNIK